MNYILFDNDSVDHLLPFTYTRPIADIRVGINTLREKWEFYLRQKTSTITRDYLAEKFPLKTEKQNILIDASVFPEENLVRAVKNLNPGEALVRNNRVLAIFVSGKKTDNWKELPWKNIEYAHSVRQLTHVWEIFSMNNEVLPEDFVTLTRGRKSQPLSSSNFVQGDPSLIFLEEGAHVEYAFLNTADGPIYIGKNATVMEGAKIRGPFALCAESVVKMDAKIYGGTTIGPHCKVGGEVSNSVIFGYSNKAHDGFLGNSVLGEWCNLGADTNVSNLKNTYEPVKLWSYVSGHFESTGRQFCGLMMGDHSKTGINTMFNTGTVVGVFANIFGDGYQRNFIPSFSWGGKHGLTHYNLKKAFQVAEAVFARRKKVFDDREKKILTHIFDITYNLRR